MKKMSFIAITVIALMSCNGATDGDPSTDTTTMNIDTATLKDTSANINTPAGTYPADSLNQSSDNTKGIGTKGAGKDSGR